MSVFTPDALARIFRYQQPYTTYFGTTDGEIQHLAAAAYGSGIQILKHVGSSALTGTRTLVLPLDNGPLNNGWIIENQTGCNVVIRGDSGTGVTLATGTDSLVFSDGSAFRMISGSGSGSSEALVGDATGPIGANTVTHVTGTDHTKINGTTDVAIQLDGVDSAKFASDGLTLGTADIVWLHGYGAPTMTAPNGSAYFRHDGTSTTTLYLRVANAWVAK